MKDEKLVAAEALQTQVVEYVRKNVAGPLDEIGYVMTVTITKKGFDKEAHMKKVIENAKALQ